MCNPLKVAFLLLSLMPVLALGQWQWLDKSGRPVFSDIPPPSDISDAQIIKRPALSDAASAPAPSSAPPVASVAKSEPGPSVGSLETLVQSKRAEEERQRARQNAQEAAREAVARAENCRRAQRALAVINSGSRLQTTNERGESVFADEAARQTEKRRIEVVIRSDC